MARVQDACGNGLTTLLGRREMIGRLLAAFTAAALVREARALAPAGSAASRWVEGQQDIAEGLASGRISGLQWAAEVERLAAEVDLAELIALVGRARISAAGAGTTNDPRKRFVRFLDARGEPRRLAYGAALFDFAPGNVITPHGHRHMVSAHMVIAGRCRIRTFDRVADLPGAMRLRPTGDRVAAPGQVSTTCSERDNIHWFVPVDGPATTFDVVVSELDPGGPDHFIQAVDPVRGTRQTDGTLVAPIIGFDEASRFYSADV